MMKVTKLAVILVAAGLTVGCASKGDISQPADPDRRSEG